MLVHTSLQVEQAKGHCPPFIAQLETSTAQSQASLSHTVLTELDNIRQAIPCMPGGLQDMMLRNVTIQQA